MGDSKWPKPRSESELESLAPVTGFVFPARANYEVTAGLTLSRALRGLAQGQFVGQISRASGRVYMPPLGADPITATATDEDVELPDTGTVLNYCVVNIPVHGQGIPLPFACANVVLDGADTPFLALIQGCRTDDVRVGLRVRAVWAEPSERSTSLASVKWFEPTGEPDQDIEALMRLRERAWEEARDA